jgi:hypothetical protein
VISVTRFSELRSYDNDRQVDVQVTGVGAFGYLERQSGKVGPKPTLTRNRRPYPKAPDDGEPECLAGAIGSLIRRGLRGGAGS